MSHICYTWRWLSVVEIDSGLLWAHHSAVFIRLGRISYFYCRTAFIYSSMRIGLWLVKNIISMGCRWVMSATSSSSRPIYSNNTTKEFVCLNALIFENTNRIWNILFAFDILILQEGHRLFNMRVGPHKLEIAFT